MKFRLWQHFALSIVGGSMIALTPSFSQEPKKDTPPTEEKKEEEKKDPAEEERKKKEEERKRLMEERTISKKEDAEVSLDPLISPTGVWDWTTEKVESEYAKAGFRWLSKEVKDRGLLRPAWMLLKEQKEEKTRTSMTRSNFKILDGKSEAEEVTFEFKEGKLSQLSMSIWNKGDAEKLLREAEFKQKLTDITAALTARLKVQPKELGKDNASASRAFRTRWETPNSFAQLEFSSTKDRENGFQPEFIRLRLAPKGKQALGAVGYTGGPTVSQRELATKVKKEANGDVYLPSVPMVDQGEKGYCALATTERVMRYYGIQCDQHDMAMAAKGDAGGTNPDELQEALHRLQNRFKIHVRDVIHWDIKDYLKFPEAYNREAKKIGAKLMPDNMYSSSFRSFDPEALKNARCRGDNYGKFTRNVRTYIDQGIPMLWGLELGIYPENGQKTPQQFGGHMRLIIGYNAKTDEIIFSDSWGAGHEMKRMAGKDAFSVTKGLYMVEPRR